MLTEVENFKRNSTDAGPHGYEPQNLYHHIV